MQRILVIRFSSIGDIVLTTPVIRLLRKQFPDADIRFVTKKQFSLLVKPNKHLNGIFELDANLGSLTKKLKEFDPDLVVDLHYNLRTRILKAQLGGKWLVFNKLNFEKWLKVNLKIDLLPNVHLVQRYIDSLIPLGMKNDGIGLEFYFDDAFIAPELPNPLTNGFVALVIGAQYKTKQLPAPKLVELCNGLNLPVLLIGGPEDEQLGRYIVGETNDLVVNGCGKYSIYESAWMLKQAKLVISHDTGMMHIASAFQKKIISVWGNTVPEFGMIPYLPGALLWHTAQVPELSCRPCSKIGFDKCPKGHFKCMEKQDIPAIVECAKQLLKRN